jgi:uncharacterized protein (TIGR03382 family)
MTFSLRLALCTVPFWLATSALAQEVPCVQDADCADGQICALVDCAAPACDPADPTCEQVDCGVGGVCVDDVVRPVDCASDADCADGETCVTESFESCGTGCVCPEGDPACGCDVAAPPACATETVSACLPAYAAPCVAASDCGDGFTCEFFEACACGGSQGSGGGDAASPPIDACECLPADEGNCVLTRVECASAADCQEGFECVAEGSTGSCLVDADGTTECGGDSAIVSICAPPGFVGGDVERETGSLAADDGVNDEEVPPNDVISVLSCQASGSAGVWPVAALGLLLRRRRRA